MGTHPTYVDLYAEMVSHQRLVFLVIIIDVFMTGWFAVRSSTADQRVCPSKVGILTHARIFPVNVARSEM